MEILKESDYDFVKTKYKSKEGDYVYIKYKGGFIEIKIIDIIEKQRWCNNDEPKETKYITSHDAVWWDEIYTIKNTNIRNGFVSNFELKKQKEENDKWFSKLSWFEQQRVNNIVSDRHMNSGVKKSEYGYYN